MTPGCNRGPRFVAGWICLIKIRNDLIFSKLEAQLVQHRKEELDVKVLVSFQMHLISVNALVPVFTLLNHVWLSNFIDYRSIVFLIRLK
jgi:hypothetical protein